MHEIQSHTASDIDLLRRLGERPHVSGSWTYTDSALGEYARQGTSTGFSRSLVIA